MSIRLKGYYWLYMPVFLPDSKVKSIINQWVIGYWDGEYWNTHYRFDRFDDSDVLKIGEVVIRS